MRRLLIDESIPGASVTLVPTIGAGDFLKLLDNPTKESLEYWILRGERSVWPAVGALKIRCAVEVELDRGYQLVRRRKPPGGYYAQIKRVGRRGSLQKRRRAARLTRRRPFLRRMMTTCRRAVVSAHARAHGLAVLQQPAAAVCAAASTPAVLFLSCQPQQSKVLTLHCKVSSDAESWSVHC